MGVFLGALASQVVMEGWRAHQKHLAEEAAVEVRTKREKARSEQAERIRTVLMQGFQEKGTKPGAPRPGFVPDDAQE